MSVKKEIPYYSGLYFITITCCKWLPLFEIGNCYNAVYRWFDHLKRTGHYITGYVIMPNHFHALIAFTHTQGKSINAIIGNGKRFMAYDIVKGLEAAQQDQLLAQLASMVSSREKRRGKLHEIFEPSFDWKDCENEWFIEQKLNYIHKNPLSGKWQLVGQPEEYLHSSARFYATGEQGIYPVLSYVALEDIDLTKGYDEK